ncbi:MAG: HNH endonuclease [Erysipelotrichales bacterium]|nr:HNH endonuclease [Erysipelotrichales bacterium]
MITTEMIESCYKYAKKIAYGEIISLEDAKQFISKESKMNSGSARDYIISIIKMIKGEKFQRTINITAATIIFNRIYRDYKEDGLEKAIQATRLNIDYYKSVKSKSLPGLSKLCDDFENIYLTKNKNNSEENYDENNNTRISSVEIWLEILKKELALENDIVDILYYYYDCNDFVSQDEVLSKFNIGGNGGLNSKVKAFGKRIIDFTKIEKQYKADGTERRWNIPFLGKQENNNILWKIRPELAEALKLLSFENPRIIENNEDGDLTSVVSREEGKKKEIYTTKYERNPKNRKDCIKFHGPICKVCGFDFFKVYGDVGDGFIEVHHINPISTLEEVVLINPENDLVPVCSNCHRMIHRKRDQVLTVEELKDKT